MSSCQIIPDHLLKHIKDLRSLKISKKLRGLRNKLNIMNLIAPANKRITFDAKNTTNLPGLEVARDLEITKNADELAQIAHVGAKQVYDWLAAKFGRDSYDNKGATLNSVVHYGKSYNNAFWDSKEMVYGDGDGKFFVALVRGDDVRCHEIFHAVTEHTAGLNYYSQSGALNEAFSDMMGISFKQELLSQEDPNTANWLLGDQVVGSEFPGKAIRSFRNEKAYKNDPQPKIMKNYSWTLSDNQGCHINSGIINFFFYNLCTLSGEASYKTPIQIMYKVLLKLGKYSGFKTFAKECRLVSKGFSPEWAKYTDGALKKVGL